MSTPHPPSASHTREPQFDVLVELARTKGLTRLGLHANQIWHDDPRRLLIMLSRYKFVAKMLSGRCKVLEVGCGDAFGARLVLQEVGALTATDFDPVFVQDVLDRMEPPWTFECKVHDILSGPVAGSPFDAAYSLDVLEHIPPADEGRYLDHVVRSLCPDGLFVVGLPSLESQVHASPRSRDGHVNCKTGPALREFLQQAFRDVFLFSMNDEVVHTGFTPMAHYLLAIGSGRR